MSSKGQISLDHTFDVGRYDYSNVWYYIVNDEICYYTQFFDNDSKVLEVKFYNSDYSFRKTCSLNFSSNSGFDAYVIYVSQKLFNDDDLIEFIVHDPMSSGGDNTFVAIYNENEQLIQKFDGAIHITYLDNPMIFQYQNSAKLIISYTDRTEIYALPGSLPNNIIEGVSKSLVNPPFPNPSSSVINLPYLLEQGQSSVMRIFNMNGQLIEIKNIDSTFDKIRLNIESYKSGIYIYEYNGVSNKFIVK